MGNTSIHDGHDYAIGVDLDNGPGSACKEIVVELAGSDGGAVVVHSSGELPSPALFHRDALEWGGWAGTAEVVGIECVNPLIVCEHARVVW